MFSSIRLCTVHVAYLIMYFCNVIIAIWEVNINAIWESENVYGNILEKEQYTNSFRKF